MRTIQIIKMRLYHLYLFSIFLKSLILRTHLLTPKHTNFFSSNAQGKQFQIYFPFMCTLGVLMVRNIKCKIKKNLVIKQIMQIH